MRPLGRAHRRANSVGSPVQRFRRGLCVGPDQGTVHWLSRSGSDDVGRGVKLALAVAANPFTVAGETHVAFDDALTHARSGAVGCVRMLGRLQRGAAAADLEIAAVEGPTAAAAP